MPYQTVDDLPQAVKDRIKSPKKRRQWLHVWNSEFGAHGDESRAFAAANSVVSKAAPMNEVNFFLPITKIDKEKRTVSGYATTEMKDLDGEIISLNAVRKALPGYMQWRNIREMHRPSAVGVADPSGTNIDDKGLFLTAKIIDDEAWRKCVEEVYKGFSIGGKPLSKVGDTITELELIEISVVDRPCNSECRFEVQKRATPDAAAYLVQLRKSRDKKDIAIEKMAEAVQSLAAQEDDEDDDPGLEKLDGVVAVAEKLSAKDKLKIRATELGVELPKDWTKKLAKSLILEAEKNASTKPPVSSENNGSSPVVNGKIESRHDLDLETGGTLDLKKRMGQAGSLAYCFDMIRDAQRSLMLESGREGGDKRDKALAKQLGTVAKSLATVIEQKASHEGEEALRLTDEGDLSLTLIAKQAKRIRKMDLEKTGRVTKAGRFQMARDNLKKAKGSLNEIKECVKAAHALTKAAILAKAAKAKDKEPDADADEEMMKILQKAYAAVESARTFNKAANGQLKKAAGGPTDGTKEYTVPPGVKELSPSTMDTGSTMFCLDQEPGAGGTVKAAGVETVSKTEAEAMARAAAAEAKVAVLEKQPAGSVYGRRPATFAVPGNPDLGSDLSNLDPEEAFRKAGGAHIGKIIAKGGTSVFDSSFKGGAI